MQRSMLPAAARIARAAIIGSALARPAAVASAASSSSLFARPALRSAAAARRFFSAWNDPASSRNYASKGLRLFVWGNGADSAFAGLRKSATGEGSQWTGPRPAHTPLLETLWSPKEVPSPDGSGFRHLSFGHEHGAFVTGNGDVYTFGVGKWGQLGVGKQMGWIATPRKVLGLPGPAVQVAAGQFHTVVLLASGEMYSMGRGNSGFFLAAQTSVIGTKDATDALAPRRIEVEGSPRFVEIAAGSLHTLARTDAGRVYSWGQGVYGRLGHGHGRGELTPKLIHALERLTVVQISCGSSFNMALDSKGDIYSWGRNEKGQLGLGQGLSFDTYVMEPAPQQVTFPAEDRMGEEKVPSMTRMVCGYKHSLAVSADGGLYMWGQQSQPLPTKFDKASQQQVVQVGAGDAFSAFTDPVGHLFTWGKGAKGCLGHGDSKEAKANSDRPTRVAGFGGAFGRVEHILAGHNHCAVLTSGGNPSS